MTIEIPKCPTCGRRPSEREGPMHDVLETGLCPDPIHDAADLGPAAVALLWELECSLQADWDERRLALLASLPVKPPESLHIASCAPIHTSQVQHQPPRYPQMRCVKCGTEGLAENMREHRCVTESKS